MRKVVLLAVLAATLVPAAAASADTFSEKRLAQKIGGHLKQSGQLHNYKVGVKFRDGVAYLSGSWPAFRPLPGKALPPRWRDVRFSSVIPDLWKPGAYLLMALKKKSLACRRRPRQR